MNEQFLDAITSVVCGDIHPAEKCRKIISLISSSDGVFEEVVQVREAYVQSLVRSVREANVLLAIAEEEANGNFKDTNIGPRIADFLKNDPNAFNPFNKPETES